jgi:DNA replication protein DnaC
VTWSQALINCAVCGTEFEARVAQIDGVEAYRAENCSGCAAELLAQERRQEAQEKLADACEKQQQVWIKECGCPIELLKRSFANFDQKAQPRAYKVMSAYDFKAGKSVLLASTDYGVGKTHLAAAVVNRILLEESPARLVHNYYVQLLRCPVYFTTESQMLARIRATFDDSRIETEEQVYRQLETVDLLIVDDVGKLRPRDSSFLQGVYFRVIDSRCTHNRPVILTTNLDVTKGELEAHIGGASADRLRGMCGKENMVLMSGKSYRR